MDSGAVSAKRVVTAVPLPADPFHRSISTGLTRRAVAHRQPLAGIRELERPAGLEVGLVEHREHQVRARRHEQRVEEIGVAIERGVAGGELDADLGGAGRQGSGRDHDVVLRKGHGHRRAVHGHALDIRRAGREVEHQRLRRVAEREACRHRPGNRRLLLARDVQRQGVAQVLDDLGAPGGDIERDARRGRGGLSVHRGCRPIIAPTRSAAVERPCLEL